MNDAEIIANAADHYAEKATGKSDAARLQRIIFRALAATARGEHATALDLLGMLSGESTEELRVAFRAGELPRSEVQ